MVNNIQELRDQLCNTFDELIENTINYEKAKEITNMAGKIIASAKVQMDYNKLTKSGKKIDFLDI